MNRIVKNIILIIFILMAILLTFSTSVEASTLGEMTSKANEFINKGSQNAGNIDYSQVTNEFEGLGQILTTIGAGVMVIIVTFMGIKYLTAGPEAQAKLKVQLIGVVVSGVVIFGAYTIWSIVVRVAEQF